MKPMEGDSMISDSCNSLNIMHILVVDDHPLVRKGIFDILSINQKYEIKEADNIDSALKILKAHHINILIVDLYLGKENGFDLIEKAKTINQDVKYVILTSSLKSMDYKRALEIGIDGYILKDAYIEDIIYALKVVARGEKYYSSQLLGQSLAGFVPKELKDLTDREKEVLIQVSKGLTNAQISQTLFITEGTTKKHISNILSKLNLNNRIEAVILARRLYGSD